MGIKIQYPAGKLQQFLLVVALGVGLIMMLDIVDYIMRDEESFDNRKEYCGVISDYYHDSNRKRIGKGHATWRLVVENQDSRKVYKVGADYIQNNIEFDQFRVGAKVCVEVIPTINEINLPFVSQIEVSGINFLDSEVVRKKYFEPLQAFVSWLFGLSCVLGFCVSIKYKKEF